MVRRGWAVRVRQKALQSAANGAFRSARTCTISNMRYLWSPLWSLQVQSAGSKASEMDVFAGPREALVHPPGRRSRLTPAGLPWSPEAATRSSTRPAAACSPRTRRREEQAFESEQALVEQIARDVEDTRRADRPSELAMSLREAAS